MIMSMFLILLFLQIAPFGSHLVNILSRVSFVLGVNCSSNHQFPYLLSSCTDFIKLCVPKESASGVVIDVAISSQDLDGIQANLSALLSAVQNNPSTILV